MKKKFLLKLNTVASVIEAIIAIFVLLACIVGGIGVLFNQGPSLFYSPEYFIEWINIICYFFIGIEFVKMIATHSAEAVVDILLIALSRQMLVDHPKALDALLIILAVGILFAIRKYLFVSKEDKHNEIA